MRRPAGGSAAAAQAKTRQAMARLAARIMLRRYQPSDGEVVARGALQPLQVLGADVRREEADELHHVAAQVGAAPEGEPRRLHREEVPAVQSDQPLLLAGAECALRDDAHAQAQ